MKFPARSPNTSAYRASAPELRTPLGNILAPIQTFNMVFEGPLFTQTFLSPTAELENAIGFVEITKKCSFRNCYKISEAVSPCRDMSARSLAKLIACIFAYFTYFLQQTCFKINIPTHQNCMNRTKICRSKIFLKDLHIILH